MIRDVLNHLNQRMCHGMTCPTQTQEPIGECPMISRAGRWKGLWGAESGKDQKGHQSYKAILLLWWPGSRGLSTDDVIAWFAEANCRVLRITHTMYEKGMNIDISDGVERTEGDAGMREWEVHFIRAEGAA